MTIAHIQTVKMTAEQYFAMGEDPTGVRLELIDGKIVATPGPNPRHADITANLTFILMRHIKPRRLGKLFPDTDVPFEKFVVRRPDLSFYATANLRRVTDERLLGPPDLCIEVLSPGNEDDDRTNKFNLYQKHRVPHYWIIDPDQRTLECFKIFRGAYKLIASASGRETASFPPFADLAIPLSELWTPAL